MRLTKQLNVKMEIYYFFHQWRNVQLREKEKQILNICSDYFDESEIKKWKIKNSEGKEN